MLSIQRWRGSHPTLDPSVKDSASLNSTAVSGVITPAGSAQASGHAPRIAIPTYTWTLPVGEIDPGYKLVLSETEQILPVCNHFGFIYQSSELFLSTARIIQGGKSRITQPDLLGTHRGTQHKQSIHDNVIINL